jgi:V/A-type H+-transporting ATPase subunit K
MEIGTIIALIGAGCAVLFTGLGSGLGLLISGNAAAGVLSEDPDKFGKVFILQIAPSTNGLYGVIVAAVMIFTQLTSGGAIVDFNAMQGWYLFVACMPITIVGFVTAILQAKLAASCIAMVGKNSEVSGGRALSIVAGIEFMQLLSMLVSFLMILTASFVV